MNYPMILYMYPRRPNTIFSFFTGWFTNHNFQIVRVYHHAQGTTPNTIIKMVVDFQGTIINRVFLEWCTS